MTNKVNYHGKEWRTFDIWGERQMQSIFDCAAYDLTGECGTPDYATGKEIARFCAIEWVRQMADPKYHEIMKAFPYSIREISALLLKWAKRYGLTREFKQYGVIN